MGCYPRNSIHWVRGSKIERMDGYDLDDTLAAANYKQSGYIGQEKVFSQAPVIYTPETPFVVITGRPGDTPSKRAATDQWLAAHQPNFRKIYYVTGSEKEKISQKARIIGRLHLPTYTDNNANVLSELKKLLPAVKFFIMRNGQRSPF